MKRYINCGSTKEGAAYGKHSIKGFIAGMVQKF